MCSRASKKPTNLMENPKIRKVKTIEMTYPAPYSQSWSGPPTQNDRKKAKRIFTSKDSSQKLPIRRDTRPQLKCRGPDPTLPHLKYGLFPKKISRGQTRVLSSKTPLTTQPMPLQQGSYVSDSKKSRNITPKGGESSPPYFMVRSLDTHLTKRLSRAASTHLDIKPRNA